MISFGICGSCGYSVDIFQSFLFCVHQATNLITKKELLTMDPDTDDGQLVYEVTTEPKHGFLESKLKPGNPITTFTQGTQTPTLYLLQICQCLVLVKRETSLLMSLHLC